MSFGGVIFGLALLAVVGVVSVSKFFLHDHCEDNGNFRDPIEYYHDEDYEYDEEEDDE